jgi:heme exporter protein A
VFELYAEGISKTYNLRSVLQNVSFTLRSGDRLGITGANGSGKTTLIKLLASVLELSSGSVSRRHLGTPVPEESYPELTGFVAPYLSLYPEYSGREHAQLISDLRGQPFRIESAMNVAEEIGIADRFDDRTGSLSSGMQQRIRYVLALLHDPPFLFLDEPMTNLDSLGKDSVRRLVGKEAPERITIIATNDPPDLELCTSVLNLDRNSEWR